MYLNRMGAMFRSLIATLCAVLLLPGETVAMQAPPAQAPASAPATQASKISPDQLDSLVAPIALYPDPLLAQTLAASTYPLEIIQLQQWLDKNKTLKDKALSDAVAKQPWDPSVQALAALPDVVNRLANDIQWTTDLGNAFLAQQSDVMDAVQRMRKKAQDTGNLKSTEQQKVETKVVESKTVIVVEQANPQVVYVPSYNPVVVYGPAYYPYPPIYYPPVGYYAAGVAISFGVGVMMGAFWSGGWGWGCGWGGSDITINRNNNFNRNSNINRPSQLPSGGGNGETSVAREELAELEVLEASAELEALAELAVRAELVVPAVRAELATGLRNYQREEAEPAIDLRNNRRAGAVIDGSTTLNIGEAHRTGTAQPRTDLGARRAGIRLPTGRQAPVNSLAARAAMLPATDRRAQFEQPDLATLGLAAVQVEAVSVTGAVRAVRIG